MIVTQKVLIKVRVEWRVDRMKTIIKGEIA